MWKLINNTPFEAGNAFFQMGKENDLYWTVAVKATFDIGKKGNLSIAEEQLETFSAPVFRGEENESSLLYESDLVPVKRKVDVLLNATAYAPDKEKTSKVKVAVQIGKWSKSLVVTGDAYWKKGLGILFKTYPAPFLQKEIIYENAFGGFNDVEPLKYEIRNPVGTGFAFKRGLLKHQKVPNINYQGHSTKKRAKKNRVAGFGPISGSWMPRTNWGGTYDEVWEDSDSPYPLDFNPLYFQSAPLDQQLNKIVGGETVTLYNLTPGGLLSFRLPQISIDFETILNEDSISHVPELSSIIIEPDYPRLICVWLGNLVCTGKENTLEYTKISPQIKEL